MIHEDEYKIEPAYNYIDEIKLLFEDYYDYLGEDLSFQNYYDEFNDLPGKYSPPDGRLFILRYHDKPAGCVAFRKISDDSCEIKRLFVEPRFRGYNFGIDLMKHALQEAKKIGYIFCYFDTVSKLKAAIHIYNELGCEEISAYYENPLKNVKYFKLDLSHLIIE